MKAVVERVAQSVPITMEIVDISTDTELERTYGPEIPSAGQREEGGEVSVAEGS